MRLAAGLRPDLLGSLQLPRPSSWIWGEGLGRVKEGIRTGEGRGKGKEEEGGRGRKGRERRVFAPAIWKSFRGHWLRENIFAGALLFGCAIVLLFCTQCTYKLSEQSTDWNSGLFWWLARHSTHCGLSLQPYLIRHDLFPDIMVNVYNFYSGLSSRLWMSLQEAVVLSLFVSCMTKLFNTACTDITEEIFSDYTALWPAAMPL